MYLWFNGQFLEKDIKKGPQILPFDSKFFEIFYLMQSISYLRNSTNILLSYYDPQSARINVQSPKVNQLLGDKFNLNQRNITVGTKPIFRTRAIISRGLYDFYPIFHCG